MNAVQESQTPSSPTALALAAGVPVCLWSPCCSGVWERSMVLGQLPAEGRTLWPTPVPSGSPAAPAAAAQEALHCQLHLPGTRGTLCIVHTGMPCGLQGQGAPGLLASSQVASMLALKEDTLCHCCVLKDGAC